MGNLIKLGLSGANVQLTAALKPLERGARHLSEPSLAGANKEFDALVGRGVAPMGRHVAVDAKPLSSLLGDAQRGVRLRGDLNAPQRSGILPMDPRAADLDTLRSATDAANRRVSESALASADLIRARNAGDLGGQPFGFGRA